MKENCYGVPEQWLFDLFFCRYLEKLKIVSPIPPTAIQALNRRTIMFNRLLFSQDSFFTTINFNIFCGPDGKLMDIYRCYNNQDDIG